MATPSIVNKIGPFSVGDDDTRTITGVTAGNSLVILWTQHGTSSRTYVISDDVNGSWTNILEQNQVGSNRSAGAGYYLNAGAGNTAITIDVSSSVNFYWMVFEVADAGEADAVGTNGLNSEAQDSTNAFAVLNPAEDLATDSIAFACVQPNTSSGLTVPTGWTDEGDGFNSKFASEIFPSGSVSESVIFTGTSNRNYAGAIVALRDAGGGGFQTAWANSSNQII